ncbi:LapA family protein [Futiania mangrovi]|uniref:LapA family protein n=1 Tax=Futiania mangrovi TaxID=2959716 RepID=A0A9J6PHC6_9PROT|nr:LapA family protein [Futiania mangrovii]MCP1337216.1 LapA family protein [Futiania mangrovii]
MKLVRFVCYLVAALLFGVIAFANRQVVTLHLDPFNPEAGYLPSVETRLAIVILATLMIGFVAGGIVMWFVQGKHRKAARAARADARIAHREAEEAQAKLPPPRPGGLPAKAA